MLAGDVADVSEASDLPEELKELGLPTLERIARDVHQMAICLGALPMLRRFS